VNSGRFRSPKSRTRRWWLINLILATLEAKGVTPATPVGKIPTCAAPARSDRPAPHPRENKWWTDLPMKWSSRHRNRANRLPSGVQCVAAGRSVSNLIAGKRLARSKEPHLAPDGPKCLGPPSRIEYWLGPPQDHARNSRQQPVLAAPRGVSGKRRRGAESVHQGLDTKLYLRNGVLI